MQTNQITKLALKLAGIYLLSQTILSIPSVVLGLKMFNQNREEMGSSFIAYLISFILLALFGILLVIKNKPELEQKETNSTDLLSVGIIVSGLIIFASAIGELPMLISGAIFTMKNSNYLGDLSAGNIVNIAMQLLGNLIQLTLGGLLFFKTKYFVKLIK
jgi:hypothetical protein